VSTNILSSAPVDYPPASLYDSARPHIQEQMHGKGLRAAMSSRRANADAFARKLVARCLRPDPGAVYWCGYLSWATWAVTRLVPVWIKVRSRRGGSKNVACNMPTDAATGCGNIVVRRPQQDETAVKSNCRQGSVMCCVALWKLGVGIENHDVQVLARTLGHIHNQSSVTTVGDDA